MPRLVTFDEYYDELIVLRDNLLRIAREQQEANRNANREKEQERQTAGREVPKAKILTNALPRRKLLPYRQSAPAAAAGPVPQIGLIRDANTGELKYLPGLELEEQVTPQTGVFMVAIEWAAGGANQDAFRFKLEDVLLNGTADFRIANTHIFTWDMNESQVADLKIFLEQNTGVGTSQWVTNLTYGPVNQQSSPKPDKDTIYPLATQFNDGDESPGEMLIEFVSTAGSIFTSDTWMYTGYAQPAAITPSGSNEFILYNNNRYIWLAGQGGVSTIYFS